MELNISGIKRNGEYSIVYSTTSCVIFQKYSKILNENRNKIDDNSQGWNKIKKIVNPYELLHISYYRSKNDSIAKYSPISRSYFKMIEILNDYKLLEDYRTTNITVSCLAEGPGGFMEAISNYRKRYVNSNDDKIYGITLKPTDKDIPGWMKIAKNIPKNLRIFYGNLYKIDDILNYTNLFVDNKAELITADGGFDYSVDFNNQESLSFRIIFCEIITALSIQKNGGNFVCKIFDIFNIFTVKMIAIIGLYYDRVYISKLKTSRIANSEKYIIAKGFKGISRDELDNFHKIIREWDINNDAELGNISDIVGIKLTNDFIHDINEYNEKYVENQLLYMNKILNYINNGISSDEKNMLIKDQINNGIMWCKKYNIMINKNSIYITSLKDYQSQV